MCHKGCQHLFLPAKLTKISLFAKRCLGILDLFNAKRAFAPLAIHLFITNDDL